MIEEFFCYRSRSVIRKDSFVLEAAKHAEGRHLRHDSVLERFAFSHAFAASGENSTDVYEKERERGKD